MVLLEGVETNNTFLYILPKLFLFFSAAGWGQLQLWAPAGPCATTEIFQVTCKIPQWQTLLWGCNSFCCRRRPRRMGEEADMRLLIVISRTEGQSWGFWCWLAVWLKRNSVIPIIEKQLPWNDSHQGVKDCLYEWETHVTQDWGRSPEKIMNAAAATATQFLNLLRNIPG